MFPNLYVFQTCQPCLFQTYCCSSCCYSSCCCSSCCCLLCLFLSLMKRIVHGRKIGIQHLHLLHRSQFLPSMFPNLYVFQTCQPCLFQTYCCSSCCCSSCCCLLCLFLFLKRKKAHDQRIRIQHLQQMFLILCGSCFLLYLFHSLYYSCFLLCPYLSCLRMIIHDRRIGIQHLDQLQSCLHLASMIPNLCVFQPCLYPIYCCSSCCYLLYLYLSWKKMIIHGRRIRILHLGSRISQLLIEDR